MHLASPAATLWCPSPPSVHLYLTFIFLSVLPSIHPPISAPQGPSFEALCPGSSSTTNTVWRRVIWSLWRGICISLATICYHFPACVCGMYSLWSSLKFLRSVCRTSAAEGRRGRGARGRACDRTTSSASVHWFSFTFLPVTCHLTLCCHLKENKRIRFSSPVCSLMLFWTADSPHPHIFSFFLLILCSSQIFNPVTSFLHFFSGAFWEPVTRLSQCLFCGLLHWMHWEFVKQWTHQLWTCLSWVYAWGTERYYETVQAGASWLAC